VAGGRLAQAVRDQAVVTTIEKGLVLRKLGRLDEKDTRALVTAIRDVFGA
jgi:hypothetical protein